AAIATNKQGTCRRIADCALGIGVEPVDAESTVSACRMLGTGMACCVEKPATLAPTPAATAVPATALAATTRVATTETRTASAATSTTSGVTSTITITLNQNQIGIAGIVAIAVIAVS